MAFFTSWQIWVKLTFVLGCAICVVLAYSIGVRYSNKRKLKKNIVLNATEIAERGETTQAVGRSEEVPFGIRAIERGCTIEGIWNSKATTPLQTPTSSKASSPVLKAAKNTLKKHKRDSSLSNMSHVDISEPALVTPSSRELVLGVLNIPWESAGTTPGNLNMEGVQEMELEISIQDRLPDGPGPALYNNRPGTETSYGFPSPWFGARVGPPSTVNAEELSEQLHPDDSASQIFKTHADASGCGKHPLHMRYITNDKEMQPHLSQPRKMPLSKGMETLEYMNAHRRCHAAETGQLIPRVRRKADSGDFNTDLITTMPETGKDHSAARSVSWPMSNTDSCNNNTKLSTPYLSPNLEELPIRILAKRLPLPPLRHTGADNAEDSIQLRDQGPSIQSKRTPLNQNQPRWQPSHYSLCIKNRVATSKPCPSSWTDRLQEQVEEIQKDYQKSAIFPLTDTVLSYHNRTARKINPGFEVLPSGTLTQPTRVKEWGDATSASADTSNEVRVLRKLQKRNRSRSRSRRSSSDDERRDKESVQ